MRNQYDGIYPASLPTSSPFMAGGLVLFNVLPKDPIGDDNYYHYTQIDDGGSYTLDFSLESGAANYATYGVLYNWPAIMQGAASSNSVPSGVQGVCPTGWHVPSHNEWTDFSTYLGSYAGGKAKEAGTTHWSVQTCGSTACNLSGFTALPAGARSISGSFVQLTNYAFFWTATKVGPYSPVYRWQLQNTQSTLISNQPEPQDGYSLRCLKD